MPVSCVELIDYPGYPGFGHFLVPVVLGCPDRSAVITEVASQHGHTPHHQEGA